MRITIAAVGRAKSGPARALFDDYRRRIAWPLRLQEVEERRPLPPDALKAREAELLLAALPKRPSGLIVAALDERGRMLDSAAFAAQLAAWRDRGVGDLAFLIGGADGHGAAALARADIRLSLGPMTWPHLLVRALLAEQLYRAQQILGNHPYHRA